MKKLVFILFICLVSAETYSWEDGGTILGFYGNISNPANVGTTGGVTPYDGDYMLTVSESPMLDTPQAFIGYVKSLNAGDVVDACFWGYDNTPGSSPSLRIWAQYSFNDDLTAYDGSAGGNQDYTDGTGWSQVCHTWTIPADKEALTIQARLYSGSTDPTPYYIDLISIETSSSFNEIVFPSAENTVSGCTDPNADNYNPDANLDDGSCEYTFSDVSLYNLQYATEATGEWDNDCYPSPYTDQYVITSGVVTAVKPGEYPNFFIQGDEDSWAGAYVFDASVNPNVGDEIELSALVIEYFGLTEISNVQTYEILSSGNSLNTVSIGTGDLGVACNPTGEQYEGMLVTVENVTVESVNQFDSWYINDGSGTTKIDDYFFDGEWPNGVVGESFGSITGVVHYAYGEYMIYPRYLSDLQGVVGFPVADAGADQTVQAGEIVVIDGSGSYDTDGSIIAYEWTQVDGPAVSLSDENSATTTFTAPEQTSTLTFRLTVFDDDVQQDVDEVAISVLGTTSLYDINFTETETGTFSNDCYPSPYLDQQVSVSGVVTAVKPGDYPNFYMQDMSGSLWSGAYVYDVSVFPSVGDEITITASVEEYYGVTELTDVVSSTTLSSDNMIDPIIITGADFPTLCDASSEQYEGMLVKVLGAEVQSIDEFNTWTTNDGTGSILFDDYFFDGSWPNPSSGETFDITGVATYSYGEYKVMPRSINDIAVSGDGCLANGDVNGDGVTNILDVVQTVNYVLNGTGLDSNQQCIVDVNGDEIVNVLDLVQLINLILG